MITGGVSAFAGKSVLLLQGPMGPFFRRLASDLRAAKATVHKVNFNGGDWLFYPRDGHAYRGRPADWPAHLEERVRDWKVDVILLFGDCRPVHAPARQLAARLGLEIGVFEEGYVRPDYITLERYGVNGHSRLPRNPSQFRSLERTPPDRCERVGNTYWHQVLWAVLYFTAAQFGSLAFRHYRHHRRLNLLETLPWLRSAWRRWSCAWIERGVQQKLIGPCAGRYFLVPLQSHNDAQIHAHSPYRSVAHFIDEVMSSFAAHAPSDALLVFKHHPLDRGYSDYRRQIGALARSLGLSHRCSYIHDQHLPTLLSHARGVVVVNSTVGLSALHHGRALKVCGQSILDIEGLSFQGPMAEFWAACEGQRPDPALLARFHEYVVGSTQLNGSFYRRLTGSPLSTGVRWSPRTHLDLAPNVRRNAAAPETSAA